jgi:hypothetical protein
MDEFQRGYERERGAQSYRARSSCLGCLLGLAFVAVVFVAAMVLSVFLQMMMLPVGNS